MHWRFGVSPFQGYGSRGVFATQGVALGWYVVAPSGRKKMRPRRKVALSN